MPVILASYLLMQVCGVLLDTMEETGFEIICGAPTTLAVKELMMMMMMMMMLA